MNTIQEALRSLNIISESFESAMQHYAYQRGNETVKYTNKRGVDTEAHGHVAGMNLIEDALRSEALVYAFLGFGEYVKEATELATAHTSINTENSTHTGIESFVGTNNPDWPSDYIYKIRFKSRLLSPAFFKETVGGLGDIIYNKYVETFGTSDFCDLVVIRNNRNASSNPDIVTFYPITKDRAFEIIGACKLNTEDSDTIAENNSEGKFVVIDSLGKHYSASHPVGYGDLTGIVVNPTVYKSSKTRSNGVDYYTEYKRGSYIDPDTREVVEFNVEELKHGKDNTVKSSKVIGEAREAFERAFWKTYCKQKGVEYHYNVVSGIPCFWVNSPKQVAAQMQTNPDVKSRLAKWGLIETEDFRLFQSNVSSVIRSVEKGWVNN